MSDVLVAGAAGADSASVSARLPRAVEVAHRDDGADHDSCRLFVRAQRVDWMLLLNTLLGTALVAAGTNALNQYIERDHDAKMRRTRLRPLPDGRIAPRAALIFSVAISIIGTLYLGFPSTGSRPLLGAFTLISYIFIYTPLKRVSTICTLIGAIPGAIPPLMGWTAATGMLGTRRLDHLRDPLFLAAPALHGDQLDVSRRLRARRFRDAGRARRRRRGHGPACRALQFRAAHGQRASAAVRPLDVRLPGGAIIAGVCAHLCQFRVSSTSRTPIRARRLFMASNIYLIVMMALLVFA